MRHQHKLFEPPADPRQPIWRYFDVTKFLSLLHTGALYFSRADMLGDPFEGSYPRGTVEARERRLRAAPKGLRRETRAMLRRQREWQAEAHRQVYINAWHRGDYESMAMWQMYGRGPYGVAIRTTYERLDAALPRARRRSPISIGCVRYIDYRSAATVIGESDPFAPYLYKSLAYAPENELRAAFALDEDGPAGIFVPVDLAVLRMQVVVSPLAPRWFRALVRATCTRLGVAARVERSVLSLMPMR